NQLSVILPFMLSSSFIISLLLAAAIARSEGAAFLRPVAEPNKRIRLCGPPLLQYIFANKLYECEGVASGGVKPNHCLLHKRLHACRAAERDLLC
ncbi:hypothetical protein PENTCL1PPCAC_9447, partial [Pristionchus entomophagus]